MLCLHVYLCIVCVYHCIYEGQKRLLDPLELELCTVVSSHVGARSQTWFISKSSSTLNHRATALVPKLGSFGEASGEGGEYSLKSILFLCGEKIAKLSSGSGVYSRLLSAQSALWAAEHQDEFPLLLVHFVPIYQPLPSLPYLFPVSHIYVSALYFSVFNFLRLHL